MQRRRCGRSIAWLLCPDCYWWN